MSEPGEKRVNVENVFFLHITIFILAVSFAFNKAASNSLNEFGITSPQFLLFMTIYIILTVAYALMWQHNLERFELGFLYTNRSFYLIWSQLIAVIVFKNQIGIINIIALGFIFLGVWVNFKDA